jgi:glyoxylase-like metal-dependent hydrolase (beta-lactamase superfamily II)
MNYKNTFVGALRCSAAMLFSALSLAQMPSPEETEVKVAELSDNIYMLMGLGGNIALSTGPDGAFIVDDELKPMSAKLKAAIATVSPAPVKMVFNTHWHFDHAGGNEFFAGDGALIVAHDNVRQRMSATQFSTFFNSETPPSPDAALPVITFDNTATFYLNGQTIKAMHVPPAHTDGDSILIFEEANVMHLGDVFFNGMYPFIDINSGGSIAGMLEAIELIMPLLNEETKIIPGHGPAADVDDLRSYQSMLSLVSARIQVLINEGKTKEQVVALRPSFNFDEDWGWQFLPGDKWVGLIYDSLVDTPRELAVD